MARSEGPASLYVLLLLSGDPAGEAGEELVPELRSFDLKDIPSPPCGDSEGNEIVVCGKRAKAMDIHTADPSIFQEKPLRAETALPFGGTIDLHGEQRTILGGQSAPAAVVTVKIPF
jgi:hypothetical protein